MCLPKRIANGNGLRKSPTNGGCVNLSIQLLILKVECTGHQNRSNPDHPIKVTQGNLKRQSIITPGEDTDQE